MTNNTEFLVSVETKINIKHWTEDYISAKEVAEKIIQGRLDKISDSVINFRVVDVEEY